MRFAFIVTIFGSLSLLAACGPSAPPNAPDGSAPAPAPSDPAAGTSPAGETPKQNPAGGPCGGIAGLGCNPGLYCAYAPEAQCGAADQTGTCQPLAEMCTQEFAPVCGCNDKTYPNACHAAREGISVLRKGECAAQAPQ